MLEGLMYLILLLMLFQSPPRADRQSAEVTHFLVRVLEGWLQWHVPRLLEDLCRVWFDDFRWSVATDSHELQHPKAIVAMLIIRPQLLLETLMCQLFAIFFAVRIVFDSLSGQVSQVKKVFVTLSMVSKPENPSVALRIKGGRRLTVPVSALHSRTTS